MRRPGHEHSLRDLAVRFEITVVDGEHGQRLAALQAEALLEVLTWLHEHRTRPAGESRASGRIDDESAAGTDRTRRRSP